MSDDVNHKVDINGKEVDFSPAVPLKLKDIRKLKALGVNITEFEEAQKEGRVPDADQLINFVFYFANKCNDQITEEDVEEIPLTDLPVIVNTIFRPEEQLDVPSSGS